MELGSELINESLAVDLHAAVESTLGQMFSIRVESTFKIHERRSASFGDVSAIIQLTNEGQLGSLVVSFPRETLKRILFNLHKKDLTESDPGFTGGAAEITNIVFGILKYRLRDKGLNFKMALPKVVIGDGHKVANTKCWALAGHFTSAAGDFQVLLVNRATI